MNDTQDLVPLPTGITPVGCRLVYRTKTRTDDSVEHYKVWLVACGFTQEYWVDYEEIFASVAKMTTVRALLAVAAIRQWPLYQLDVMNALKHGNLYDEVYMIHPPGLPHSSHNMFVGFVRLSTASSRPPEHDLSASTALFLPLASSKACIIMSYSLNKLLKVSLSCFST